MGDASVSQERTQLINSIVKSMPIVDREALSRMTMEQLGNLHMGRLRTPQEYVPPRPSDLARTMCPLECHTCNGKWHMMLYAKVATVVWCPHCGIELETMTEEEMG